MKDSTSSLLAENLAGGFSVKQLIPWIASVKVNEAWNLRRPELSCGWWANIRTKFGAI